MSALRVRGRHYRSGKLYEWACAGGTIVERTEVSGDEGDHVAPAFFDIQINGALGISFNAPTLTSDDIRRVTALCRQHGIAEYFPTLVTASQEDLLHAFRALSRARAEDSLLARAIPGFHLEGPYISPEDGPRGAHPLAHVRPPSWAEFSRLQEAAEGSIRLVTLAPEKEGALAFIEKLTASGVVVALGHTAAAPAVIRAAVDAGARLSTHLGNGSHALLPRHENYFLEQLAEDRLIASVISDGHHVPASLLRILIRVKGAERIIVTCDASNLAGLPPGRHTAWGQEFEIQAAGKIVVPGTPFLAGSGVFTDDCVRHLLGLGEMGRADVLDAAGNRPRTLFALPARNLEVGEAAAFVLIGQRNGLPILESLPFQTA
jgi:N-acetylglucosamine-6-phosphate deacetylase